MTLVEGTDVFSLRKRLHFATIAHFATAQTAFALAVKFILDENQPAFQASSPKNFHGLVFGSARFFRSLGSREMSVTLAVRSIALMRKWANQLIYPQRILRARCEQPEEPIQKSCH
ncbi:hypothetical protein [Sphingobium abikonense]|uniref:hypothetical protein n=1 Tax=Sphingobium abikonense TaxID=86193 RepID=UPI0035139733